MDELNVDMGATIDLNDERRLEEILAEIGPDEELILTMNRADAHEADPLIALLEDRGFEIQPKGGEEDEYYLHCRRRKTR